MLKNYNYIEYPEDRLYLRVGNLLSELMSSLRFGNLDYMYAYNYLRTIKEEVKPDLEYIEKVKKTEKFLVSPSFINQDCFKHDKEKLIPIIREYKLRMINI